MDKDQLLEHLNNYESRLISDVKYNLDENYVMGVERWNSWVRSSENFFANHLPYYLNDFKSKAYKSIGFKRSLTEVLSFMHYRINPTLAFIQSITFDIQNDDYIKTIPLPAPLTQKCSLEKKAFIVHGHDEAAKERTARFLEKLGFQAVILQEQANSGKTIIEKLEKYTDVGFGIVLYTPDDVGEAKANKDNLRPRARQNVVFEHGLLIGKLGRERAFTLVTDHSIELPNDISGMVYMSDRNWEFDLAKEIKALGYTVDLNVLF